MATLKRDVLDPAQCRKILPELTQAVWLYRYTDPVNGWVLSIATHGEKGSGKLSLGGFRIVPEERAATPGFSPDREAIGLALGMEEKIFWSRLLHIAGPLGKSELHRVVGGKCVLLPTRGARVGEPEDRKLLGFALEALKDFEDYSGVCLVTGQDLGHGMMSDGTTSSLEYLSSNFRGSVIADTGKPTGEGNFYLMLGALKALGIEPGKARIGLIGCGNIGDHLRRRLAPLGVQLGVLEASPRQRRTIAAEVASVWDPAQKAEFIEQPFDALAVNALGGSLDSETVAGIIANKSIKLITGCENLAMPDAENAERLRKAERIFSPTEMCGMMGYLTAVENYLCRERNVPFEIEKMLPAAAPMADVGERATEHVLKERFRLSFEDAVRALWGEHAHASS